jgi:hypothetical protein
LPPFGWRNASGLGPTGGLLAKKSFLWLFVGDAITSLFTD